MNIMLLFPDLNSIFVPESHEPGSCGRLHVPLAGSFDQQLAHRRCCDMCRPDGVFAAAVMLQAGIC